ncbi:hypothetical protein AMC99_01365 [Altererythrobacter epoxidivorans]|uniref:Uncharacterized protein n=1 Tax=Altererythrobacter epoxidivorans TaxID=361183 RepID=A0A0M4LV80_9SPHN|nr:hypothetical protein AMC99_01365 [Altererythrobacter epoxidivorans]
MKRMREIVVMDRAYSQRLNERQVKFAPQSAVTLLKDD